MSGNYFCDEILVRNSEDKDTHQIFIFIQTFFQQNSGKKTEEVLPNHKINKWKLVMKLHWDIINKDFNEKVDIVEEDLEEILPKSDFVPNLFQVCQLL